jgi:hypothetical protein
MDVEKDGIEVIARDSQCYLASLSVEPTLINMIKNSQASDHELVKIKKGVQMGGINMTSKY